MATPGEKVIRECSVEGCGRAAAARGWCFRHYQRWLRNGHPSAAGTRGCVVEGCGRKHYARGYCRAHYLVARTNREVPAEACSRAGCDAGVRAHGLCAGHYREAHRRGQVEGQTLCYAEGCGNGVLSNGLCQKHARRLKDHGDPALTHRVIADRLLREEQEALERMKQLADEAGPPDRIIALYNTACLATQGDEGHGPYVWKENRECTCGLYSEHLHCRCGRVMEAAPGVAVWSERLSRQA